MVISASRKEGASLYKNGKINDLCNKRKINDQITGDEWIIYRIHSVLALTVGENIRTYLEPGVNFDTVIFY